LAWSKSPPELVARFEAAIPWGEDVVRRQMFGYPAAFAHGHMCAGLFQDQFVLRLPDDLRAAATRDLGALPFTPMPGRTMREYVVLPRAVLAEEVVLQRLLAAAIGFVASLPAKPAKKAARRRS
jgi:TfoX/Sxy family transcriptional regulator of competence genes